MTDNPKITVKYSSLVIPGYIDTAIEKPLTISATVMGNDAPQDLRITLPPPKI